VQVHRNHKEKEMAKVTITGLGTRKDAKDYKKTNPIYVPKASPSPVKSYMKTATESQDKKYNEIQM
jgi:hypothetical protein